MSASRLGVAAVAIAALGCEPGVTHVPATQVTVRMQAARSLRDRLDALHVRVFAEGPQGWEQRDEALFSKDQLPGWPVDVVVVPAEGHASGEQFEVVAELLDDAQRVIVQQRATGGFVPRMQRMLVLTLSSCGDAICEPDASCHGAGCATCLDGRCGPAPVYAASALPAATPWSAADTDASLAETTADGGTEPSNAHDAGVSGDAGAPGEASEKDASMPSDASDASTTPGAGFGRDPLTADQVAALTDHALVEAVAARGRACGVYGPGDIGAFVDSASERCTYGCLAQLSCSLLSGAVCATNLSPALVSCTITCTSAPPSFLCADGSSVPYAQLCNGTPGCADGEDERYCHFSCGSGESIATGQYCDKARDCTDGSDERGCALEICEAT